MSPVHCIYHAGCPDGFTAAWVVREKHGDAVTFHEGAYGAPPPDDIEPDATVYVVDFSFPRQQLIDLSRRVERLVLLDHHATAQADLDGIAEEAPITVTFDMGRSGAGITWDVLFDGAPRPQIVAYVEDRDLWRFDLPGSEDVAPLFMGTEFTFENWDALAHDLETAWPNALAQGRAMRRMREKIIGEIADTARYMTIGGSLVPVAGSPYALGSDVAGKLAEPSHVPFAAYYVDRPGGRQFGLRSADTGADVSKVARLYGGGGHRHAAGFTVPWGHELTQPAGG